MKTFFAIVLLCVIAAPICLAEEAPDWAKRDFAAPANQVFAAGLKSLQQQKHEVKWKDDHAYTVEFHVGTTAWSWGYTMRLVVTPKGDSNSSVMVGIARSGGKTFSWGSGKKEVNKILAGIDAELSAPRAGSN
jgi:hypothetical protein